MYYLIWFWVFALFLTEDETLTCDFVCRNLKLCWSSSSLFISSDNYHFCRGVHIFPEIPCIYSIDYCWIPTVTWQVTTVRLRCSLMLPSLMRLRLNYEKHAVRSDVVRLLVESTEGAMCTDVDAAPKTPRSLSAFFNSMPMNLWSVGSKNAPERQPATLAAARVVSKLDICCALLLLPLALFATRRSAELQTEALWGQRKRWHIIDGPIHTQDMRYSLYWHFQRTRTSL